MEFNSYSIIYRYNISSMMDLYILLMEFVVQWWFCEIVLMGHRDTLGMDEVSVPSVGKKTKSGDKLRCNIGENYWVEIGDLMT